MTSAHLAVAVALMLRRPLLLARAAFYDARASWQEGKKATLPDAGNGIESAMRHSGVAYEADRSRRIAAELRMRADGKWVGEE